MSSAAVINIKPLRDMALFVQRYAIETALLAPVGDSDSDAFPLAHDIANNVSCVVTSFDQAEVSPPGATSINLAIIKLIQTKFATFLRLAASIREKSKRIDPRSPEQRLKPEFITQLCVSQAATVREQYHVDKMEDAPTLFERVVSGAHGEPEDKDFFVEQHVLLGMLHACNAQLKVEVEDHLLAKKISMLTVEEKERVVNPKQLAPAAKELFDRLRQANPANVVVKASAQERAERVQAIVDTKMAQ